VPKPKRQEQKSACLLPIERYGRILKHKGWWTRESGDYIRRARIGRTRQACSAYNSCSPCGYWIAAAIANAKGLLVGAPSRSLPDCRLCGCSGMHMMLHLLLGDVADVGGEIPPVAERIREAGGPVAVELVGKGADHGCAGGGGLFGGGVYI